MSDDFRSEMAALLESGGRATLKNWERLLRTGGKRRIKMACQKCDQMNTFEVEVVDAEQQRHILTFLASNALPKMKEESLSAKDLRPYSEWTDEELAGENSVTEDDLKEYHAWAKQRVMRRDIRSASSGKPSKSP